MATVASLDKAVAAAHDKVLDLAILDMNIRGQESYAVADVLVGRGIPFVFATGYERARLREPYRQGNVLQKPFKQSDLEQVISAVVI